MIRSEILNELRAQAEKSAVNVPKEQQEAYVSDYIAVMTEVNEKADEVLAKFESEVVPLLRSEGGASTYVLDTVNSYVAALRSTTEQTLNNLVVVRPLCLGLFAQALTDLVGVAQQAAGDSLARAQKRIGIPCDD